MLSAATSIAGQDVKSDMYYIGNSKSAEPILFLGETTIFISNPPIPRSQWIENLMNLDFSLNF